jgi:hypothetical protein
MTTVITQPFPSYRTLLHGLKWSTCPEASTQTEASQVIVKIAHQATLSLALAGQIKGEMGEVAPMADNNLMAITCPDLVKEYALKELRHATGVIGKLARPVCREIRLWQTVQDCINPVYISCCT